MGKPEDSPVEMKISEEFVFHKRTSGGADHEKQGVRQGDPGEE